MKVTVQTFFRSSFIVIAFGTALLVACAGGTSTRSNPTAESTKVPAALPPELFLSDYPLGTDVRPTTDGADYLAHVEGKIVEFQHSKNANSALLLAGTRYQRYQILGNLEDLDFAFAQAKLEAAGPNPSDDALLLWATLAAYMHEFDAARAALTALSPGKAGAGKNLLAEIDSARGTPKLIDVDSALTPGNEFAELLGRAGYCVDRGDLFCATRLYHQAQFVYHDVSPLPLAWLHTQQGIALLRFGHPEIALRFFEAALARLPNYYLAAEHRAECLGLTGKLDMARAQYAQVIAQTGNPEYQAGLADVEAKAGHKEIAAQWQSQAKSGYAQRLEKFPNAYAQHAVEFYLDLGDLAQARALANRNLELRQDVGAYVLLAEVAQVERNKSQFCQAFKQAYETGLKPPELQALTEQAKKWGCG